MRAVPAVIVMMMVSTLRTVKSGTRSMPPVNCPEWNRKVNEVDWMSASTTVT